LSNDAQYMIGCPCFYMELATADNFSYGYLSSYLTLWFLWWPVFKWLVQIKLHFSLQKLGLDFSKVKRHVFTWQTLHSRVVIEGSIVDHFSVTYSCCCCYC